MVGKLKKFVARKRKRVSVRRTTRTVKYLQQVREANKRASDRYWGSQGPAGPVKRIDPATGAVIEVIDTTAVVMPRLPDATRDIPQ